MTGAFCLAYIHDERACLAQADTDPLSPRVRRWWKYWRRSMRPKPAARRTGELREELDRDLYVRDESRLA